MPKLIQFNKLQTATCIKYLINSIATIANHDDLPASVEEVINDLSIVLAVMRKCHESAPDIPNLSPSAAEKAPNKARGEHRKPAPKKGETMKCKECEEEVSQKDFDEETETCYECLSYMDEAARECQRQMVQVTRDMAIDAGDRSLEGQWIEW